MSKEMLYTPTPWGIERTEYKNWVGLLRKDGKVNEIVFCTEREALRPESKAACDANAAFIVRAVNCFEDLQEALEVIGPHCLEAIADYLDIIDERLNTKGKEAQNDLRRMAKLSRATLAKCKEGE